jgi:hypothetical protein
MAERRCLEHLDRAVDGHLIKVEEPIEPRKPSTILISSAIRPA